MRGDQSEGGEDKSARPQRWCLDYEGSRWYSALQSFSTHTVLKLFTETPEGLDKKFSLHYYSRFRFAQNLLPLLKRAAEGPAPALSSLVSVLAAGLEGPINKNDISLKTTYSLRACANHATTMNSLAIQTLAKENPGITFVHSAPGGVQTNLVRGLGKWGKMAVENTYFLWRRWAVPIQESGERHLWAATSESTAKGGAVLIGADSSVKTSELVKKMKEDGTEKLVWDHTNEVFDKICKAGGKY
jgi:NAD(P)-dependent dehydrogenase (short-subunit alcohol dehydrogenase family)